MAKVIGVSDVKDGRVGPYRDQAKQETEPMTACWLCHDILPRDAMEMLPVGPFDQNMAYVPPFEVPRRYACCACMLKRNPDGSPLGWENGW